MVSLIPRLWPLLVLRCERYALDAVDVRVLFRLKASGLELVE